MRKSTYTVVAVLAGLLAINADTFAANTPNPTQTFQADSMLWDDYVENEQLIGLALLRSYANCITGQLRELAEQLQTISQHAWAGEINQDEAQELKLAATRAAIARLETISAVYDSQLAPADDDSRIGAGSELLHTSTTVSVTDLERENAK